MQPTIELKQALGRLPQTRMSRPVDFVLGHDQPIAIMGPNGGGKSSLVDLITGKNPLLQES